MATSKPHTILNCYFAECSQFLKSLNVNLKTVLGQCEIDFRNDEPLPRFFNEKQLETVIDQICRQANLPELGLLVGKHIRFGFDSLDAIPNHHQLTLKQCLWALSRYLMDSFPQLVIEFFESEKVVGYRLIRFPGSAPHLRFHVEVLAAMMSGFLRFLVGDNTQPEYIAFNYSSPSSKVLPDDSYKDLFPCELYFDRAHFEFAISRQMAETRVFLDRRNCVPFSRYHSIGNPFPLQLYSLSQRIQKLMENNMEKVPTEALVAESLRMSARTLRRKLSSLNSTFQKEVDFFRRNLAFKYLLSSELDITGIAFELGYSDSSAFSKAFRRWVGIPPREFKKQFCSKR